MASHFVGFKVAVDLAAGVRAERDRVRDELGFFRHVKAGGHLDGLRSKVTVDFKRPGLDGLGVDRGGVRRQDPEGKCARHLKRFDVLREDRAVLPREREGVVVREFHGSRPGVHAERADTHVTREGCGDRTFFRFADRDRVVRGSIADHLIDRGVFGGLERPVQNEVHLGLVVAQKVLNRPVCGEVVLADVVEHQVNVGILAEGNLAPSVRQYKRIFTLGGRLVDVRSDVRVLRPAR